MQRRLQGLERMPLKAPHRMWQCPLGEMVSCERSDPSRPSQRGSSSTAAVLGNALRRRMRAPPASATS
jgi:hypothetical protein